MLTSCCYLNLKPMHYVASVLCTVACVWQRENLEIFDWRLTVEQRKAIGGMDKQRSLYRFAEPDTYL